MSACGYEGCCGEAHPLDVQRGRARHELAADHYQCCQRGERRAVDLSQRQRQYTALRFTQRRVDAGAAPSTGSTGDSFDNALAENLWSTIKVELMYWPGTTFATRAEAEHALLRYIETSHQPKCQATAGRSVGGGPVRKASSGL